MLCKFPVGQTQSQLPNADLVIKVADSEIQVRPLVGSDEHCCAKINAMHMHDRKNRTYVPINLYRPFFCSLLCSPMGQSMVSSHLADWEQSDTRAGCRRRALAQGHREPIWCTYSLKSRARGAAFLVNSGFHEQDANGRSGFHISMAVEVCHGAAAPYYSQSREEMRSRPVMAVASKQPAAPCHT
jgi:hypothetical protein